MRRIGLLIFLLALAIARCGGGESKAPDTGGRTGEDAKLPKDTAAEVVPDVKAEGTYEPKDAIPSEVAAPRETVGEVEPDVTGDGPPPEVVQEVVQEVAHEVVQDVVEDVGQDVVEDVGQDVVQEVVEEVGQEVIPQELPPLTDHLVINEFLVTPTEEEFVEIYNGTAGPVDVSGWWISVIGSNENSWSLPAVVIEGGAFLVLKTGEEGNLTPIKAGDSLLPNQGATIVVKNGDTEVDSVSYGTFGPAPGPIYGTSTGRVTDGKDSDNDATDFNWDPTPTPGASNDIAGVSLVSSPLVLSEVFMNKKDKKADFIELASAVNVPTDVSGWTLVFSGAGKGDDFVFPEGSVIQGGELFVLEEGSFPQYASLAEKGFLYLFDTNGVRVLQKGWSTLPEDGSASLGYVQLPSPEDYPYCYDTQSCSLVPLTPTKGEPNKAF